MKSSKPWSLVILILNLIVIFSQGSFAGEGDNWPIFQGAWFRIKYPPDFQVKPSLKSKTSLTGYDSAFFVSPDQKVEFYVFSPQWGGEPEDFQMNPARETLLHDNSESKGNRKVRMVTVRDKEGAYCRSWLDIQDAVSHTRLVFGIKYRDQSAYHKYRNQYLLFKKSLTQFAD